MLLERRCLQAGRRGNRLFLRGRVYRPTIAHDLPQQAHGHVQVRNVTLRGELFSALRSTGHLGLVVSEWEEGKKDETGFWWRCGVPASRGLNESPLNQPPGPPRCHQPLPFHLWTAEPNLWENRKAGHCTVSLHASCNSPGTHCSCALTLPTSCLVHAQFAVCSSRESPRCERGRHDPSASSLDLQPAVQLSRRRHRTTLILEWLTL